MTENSRFDRALREALGLSSEEAAFLELAALPARFRERKPFPLIYLAHPLASIFLIATWLAFWVGPVVTSLEEIGFELSGWRLLDLAWTLAGLATAFWPLPEDLWASLMAPAAALVTVLLLWPKRPVFSGGI